MTITGPELGLRLREFYTRQYGLIDSGAAEECAATFAADATLVRNAGSARMRAAEASPVHRGRDGIARALARTVRRRARAGVVRRHFVGPLTYERTDAATVRTRYYLLVVDTGADGPHLRSSCVVRDVLTGPDGRWLTRHRTIDHDETAALATKGNQR